ncbi:MAG TPA: hypothetical protein VEQ59_15525, partial [Polyangiaceae bacterium]|nr:hypothetical protein [Polyangiaceae bacterium]
MRLFRLFLAAVVLLGFGLSTLPARAAGTLTWSLPQWKNRHGTNRLTDLLNRDDCLSDATATFSIQVRGAVASGAVLEMWVGNACDTAANRLPANQQCVQVTSAVTAITATSVQVRMQDMVKAYGSSGTGTKDSCDVEQSTGLVTRSLFFVVYNSGSTTSEATATPWVFKYDVRAPAPPTNVRAGSGEESLVTTFSAVTGESNLLHYKFYCSPVGPAPKSSGSGGTDSGGTTSIAKQEIGGTSSGGTTGTDTGGTDTGGTVTGGTDTGGTDTGGTDTGGTGTNASAGTDTGGTSTTTGSAGETSSSAGTAGTSGNSQSDDPGCTSSILIPGEPAPARKTRATWS